MKLLATALGVDENHHPWTPAALSIKVTGQRLEFTHGIEAVLDRIRSGHLAVDSDIITTLLEARDSTKRLAVMKSAIENAATNDAHAN